MVYLLGGGGHSKQVIDIFFEMQIPIEGIFDDKYMEKSEHQLYRDVPVLGKIDDSFILSRCNDNILYTISLFCTIGDNSVRKNLCLKFPKVNWLNCISPTARISPSVKIGKGNYIGGYTQILSDSVIGDFNILNEAAVVTHDVNIGSFNHLAPGAVICGNVSIGDLNLIGASSTVLPKINIKNNNTFGAGAVVNQNIPSNGRYVGVPIRKIAYQQCFNS